VIHADLTLPVLEALLDRPAQGRRAAQRGQRGVGRRVREGVFELPVLEAAQEEPDGRGARQATSARIGPFAPSASTTGVQGQAGDWASTPTVCARPWVTRGVVGLRPRPRYRGTRTRGGVRKTGVVARTLAK
jgi:hypothetical protein